MTRVTTTCPQCSTVFRVNPEQLAARRGQVRCGRCRHVFNGYETVSVGPDGSVGNPVGSVRSRAEASEPRVSWWQKMGGMLPGRRATVPATPLRPEGLTKMVELVRSGPAAGSVEAGALRITQAMGLDLMAPALADDAPRTPQQRLVGRVMLVLFFALLPVAVFGLRGYVVKWVPDSRSLFVAICTPLGCSTPLPADAERWSIEGHELRENRDHPAVIELSATLRNRASFAQAYPALELHLTDSEGNTVQRIILSPSQFLPADHPVDAGLTANSEINVRAELKPKVQGTAGYRLVLFFP